MILSLEPQYSAPLFVDRSCSHVLLALGCLAAPPLDPGVWRGVRGARGGGGLAQRMYPLANWWGGEAGSVGT